MKKKYSQWFEKFKEVVANKEGTKSMKSLFNQTKNCKSISNDSEMAECVRNLMKNFDNKISSNSKRYAIMEDIGSICVQPMLQQVKEIRETSKTLFERIKKLNALYGEDYFILKENEILSELDRCLCHYGVAASDKLISPTYCQCSLGYMKILFKTLLGEPVDVKMTETVLTGGNKCKFIIKIPNLKDK
ncbi:MAG: hypothetical protein EU547_04510 [Promethearchaeota archaeon]|nr:MAG: hypothetical protein EU547_04510 [Candidatus Lokiarchaeota archaeon]